MEEKKKKIRPRLLLRNLPCMDILGEVPEEAEPCGAGNYLITFEGTTKEAYDMYLEELQKAGFVKYVDNGDGLDGVVFSATYILHGNAYTWSQLVVTITYIETSHTAYISACENLPLSEHLIYKDEYVQGNKEGASTSLHMMELFDFGNSFVFQLKNGHFIISDGGTDYETPYLIDYLEKLAPEGEKPIVEAWFISHGHCDHGGVLYEFISDSSLAARICVEGVYYNEPSAQVMSLDPWMWSHMDLLKASIKGCLKTSEGKRTEIYRPQIGQRYYFSDITVDIVVAQEQIPYLSYHGDFGRDFNDSTTWCMFNVEGQKCLFCGDGDMGGTDFIMNTYSKEYLNVDIFTLQHHGFNTRDEFTDFCTVKTVLATIKGDWKITPLMKKREMNDYLKTKSEEWLVWGDGTKILTFPYAVGSYETLPNFEWIYHPGVARPGE